MIMVMVMIQGIRGGGLMFKSLSMFRLRLYSIMGNALHFCLFQGSGCSDWVVTAVFSKSMFT